MNHKLWGVVLTLALVLGLGAAAHAQSLEKQTITDAVSAVPVLDAAGSVTYGGSTLSANAGAVSVLSLVMKSSVAGEYVQTITVDVTRGDVSVNNPSTYLAPLAAAANASGIAVYVETSDPSNGFQRGDDTPVNANTAVWGAAGQTMTATLTYPAGALPMAAADLVFYIVVRASAAFTDADTDPATAGIQPMKFTARTSLTNWTFAGGVLVSLATNSRTSGVLTADTTPPDPTQVTASTVDEDADGTLDGMKLNFIDTAGNAEKIADPSLTGYADATTVFATADFVVAGVAGTSIDPNGPFHIFDAANDDVLYVTFNEGWSVPAPLLADCNTEILPDVTTIGAGVVTDLAGNPIGAAITAPDIAETDGAPPVIFQTVILDTDGDGRIDRADVQFSEDIAPASIPDYDGWTVVGYGYPAAGDPGDVPALAANQHATDVVQLTMVEIGSGYDTGNKPQVVYNAAQGEVEDVNLVDLGTVLSGTSVEVDAAPPVLISATTKDNDQNGQLDAYDVLFSEAVVNTNNTTDVAANGFTIGDGYSIDAATSTGENTNTFILPINEAGRIDTGIRPALNTGTAVIVDLARDRLGAPAANALANPGALGDGLRKDGALPQVMAAETSDSDSDGKLDGMLATFSESMNPTGLNVGVKVAGYTVASVTYVAGARQATYNLTEKNVLGDTGVIPEFTYTPGTVQDANGLALAAVAVGDVVETDAAPPIIVDAATRDIADGTLGFVLGRIDGYVLTFSEDIEDLADATLYDDNFGAAPVVAPANGTVGRVVNDAQTIKTANTLTFVFGAEGVWDTNDTPEILYTSIPVNPLQDKHGVPLATIAAGDLRERDGAKPHIVAAETGDRNSDGYIDMFALTASEPITVGSTTLTGLTVDQTLNYNGAAANTVTIDSLESIDAATNTAFFFGTSSMTGTWDTEATPNLNYDAMVGTIQDTLTETTPNAMVTRTGIATTDNSRPVIVLAIGQVASTNLRVWFSEPVWDDVVPFGGWGAAPAGNLELPDFAYLNVYNTGTNATAVAAVAEGDGRDEFVTLTVDNNFIVEDVQQDSLRVNADAVFDAADNTVLPVYVTIDDVLAPKVTAMGTVDSDQDGLIDHIRVTLSEFIDDSSLFGFVVVDSMSAEISIRWDVAGFTGERWNLYNYFGGTDTDADGINDLFDAAVGVGGPNNLASATNIDLNGDGGLDIIVYVSALEGGAIAFSDNLPDDDVLYIALDEASGAANAATGIGNTDAAPGVAIANPTVADFKPNVLDVVNSANVAKDEVGPVIMQSKTIAVTKAEVVFSEDIDAASLGVLDFNLLLPAGVARAVARVSEPMPGVALLEVMPGIWWMPDAAGTITYAGNARVSDIVDLVAAADPDDPNWNSHIGNPRAGAVAVDDNVATTFVMTPSTAAPAVGEAFMVQVTATDSDGETDTNFAGEIALGVQVGDAAFPNGERYSLTNGVGSFPVVATSTDPLMVRASYDYGNEIVAAGMTAEIVPNGLDAPDVLTVADYPGDQGGMLIVSFDASTGMATCYRIYREVIDADSNAMWLPWAKVDAIPGMDPIMAVVPTLDNVASRWAVAAELGAEGSGMVPSAKRIGDGYLMALLDQRVAEIYGLGSAVQMQSQKAAKERIRMERLAPQLMALARSMTIRAKMIGSVTSAMTISADAVAAVDNIAPAAVTDLAGVASGDNNIVLSWTLSTDDKVVSSYEFQGVKVAIGGVEVYQIVRDDVVIASVPAGMTTYTDESAEIGIFYTYQVVAADLDNMSPSEAVGVSTGLVDDEGNVVVDFDGDRTTGLGDFIVFVAAWGTGDRMFDLDGNGTVGLGDFLKFSESYGRVAAGSGKPIQMGLREGSLGLILTSDAVRVGEPVSFDAMLTADASSYGLTVRYDADLFEYLPDGSMVIDRDGTLTIAGTDPVSLVFLVKEEFEGDASFEILDAMVLDRDGLGLVRSESAVVSLAPTEFELSQNIPNPFNPETAIGYALPKSAYVRLEVLNVLGQVVRTLVDGHQRTGTHEAMWDGLNDSGQALASGIYFYRIGADNFQATKRMLLLK
jgi:hypothetical protein